MNEFLSSIHSHRIARALLVVFAATAACTFLSACTGPAYRHERRVDRRVDRHEDRWDRRYDRGERRYERWN
jgi:hypothetical protein